MHEFQVPIFFDRVIKSAKSSSVQASASNLALAKGEIILDVDGTVPTQPVLQHVGITAWPGKASVVLFVFCRMVIYWDECNLIFPSTLVLRVYIYGRTLDTDQPCSLF